MKILVLGSGGREHALAWKIKQSPACETVYLYPGNAGTQKAGFVSLNSPSHSAADLTSSAREAGVELIVIGPELYLEQGYSDHFREHGFWVVGASQSAARLETSKVFAKEFMVRSGTPTAPFQVASTLLELSEKLPHAYPTVLKLDGLAAGKGVVIAKNRSEAMDFAARVWQSEEFGRGPHQVLIEEFIPGKEISYIGFCDGQTFLPCATATDHKRVFDGDEGPNTGGMGVISPSPHANDALLEKIHNKLVSSVLMGLQKERMDYRGILYFGIMVDAHGEPHVLEFNARFGDPEAQTILLRLESDLVPLLLATAQNTLSHVEKPRWKNETAVYVVAAAEGYPAKPCLGDLIGGVDTLPKQATVFFSGVAEKEGFLITSGGRVLGVGCLGKTLEDARTHTYDALKKIHWRGMHYRTDIGIVRRNA